MLFLVTEAITRSTPRLKHNVLDVITKGHYRFGQHPKKGESSIYKMVFQLVGLLIFVLWYICFMYGMMIDAGPHRKTPLFKNIQLCSTIPNPYMT